MATAPLKSKPLHNCSLQFLNWGGTGTAGTTTSTNRFRRPDHEPDDRHNRVGSRTARTSRFACSTSPPVLHNNDETDEVAAAKEAEAMVEEAAQRPWKLRPRKPAVPVAGGASRSGNMEAHEKGVQVHGNAKSTRLIETVTAERQCSTEEKKKKRRFLIALSKEEVEEDFFIITGSRPNRRPKKRPRNVQKQMDSVFPGLWLVGATADSFKVVNKPAKR